MPGNRSSRSSRSHRGDRGHLRLIHDDPIVEMTVRLPRSLRDKLEKLAADTYAIELETYVREWLNSAVTIDTTHAGDRSLHSRTDGRGPRRVTEFRRRLRRHSGPRGDKHGS